MLIIVSIIFHRLDADKTNNITFLYSYLDEYIVLKYFLKIVYMLRNINHYSLGVGILIFAGGIRDLKEAL